MARKARSERVVPTRADLVQALVSPWKLADIIGFHGGSKAFGECHYDLSKFIWGAEAGRKQLILMPRGHLKTTIASVLRALHLLYVNPNIRVFIGSANKNLSSAIVREIQLYLLDEWNQRYIWNNRPHFRGRMIPIMDTAGKSRRSQRNSGNDDTWTKDKKQVWRADAIQVIRPEILKEPSVVVGSVESCATGFHYDALILDDVLTYNNYNTQSKRESLDRWIEDMMSVIDPEYYDEELYETLCACTENKKYHKAFERLALVGDRISVVGTLYFKDDWYSRLMDANALAQENNRIPEYQVYKKNIYKNGADRTEGYLWHEKWTESVELTKRAHISSKVFASQYLNSIIVTEEQILHSSKIRFFRPDIAITRIKGTRFLTVERDGEPRLIFPTLVIDPAATTNKESDFTAMAVGGIDKDLHLYIVDMRVGKWQTDQWIEIMYDLVSKWDLKGIYLEQVGFQAVLKEVIKSKFSKYYPIVIKDYRPGRKNSKTERIEMALQPLLENGMLHMAGYLSSQANIMDQFNLFPSPGVKDDALDVISILREISKPPSSDPRKREVAAIKHNTTWGGFY